MCLLSNGGISGRDIFPTIVFEEEEILVCKNVFSPEGMVYNVIYPGKYGTHVGLGFYSYRLYHPSVIEPISNPIFSKNTTSGARDSRELVVGKDPARGVSLDRRGLSTTDNECRVLALSRKFCKKSHLTGVIYLYNLR